MFILVAKGAVGILGKGSSHHFHCLRCMSHMSMSKFIYVTGFEKRGHLEQNKIFEFLL
jgi:hypothetical protein